MKIIFSVSEPRYFLKVVHRLYSNLIFIICKSFICLAVIHLNSLSSAICNNNSGRLN